MSLSRAQKRTKIYNKLKKKNRGFVPCFKCGKHVNKKDASLEHKLPLSKGGTDAYKNLTISHKKCNNDRGNDLTKEDLNKIPYEYLCTRL